MGFVMGLQLHTQHLTLADSTHAKTVDHNELREILSRTGADYAIWWRLHTAKLHVWEHFEPPELLTKMKDRGFDDDESFAKCSYKYPVAVDDLTSPVAHVFRSKSAPLVLSEEPSERPLEAIGQERAQLCTRFEIRCVVLQSHSGGVLEFGSGDSNFARCGHIP